jgi:hypothetical protein
MNTTLNYLFVLHKTPEYNVNGAPPATGSYLAVMQSLSCRDNHKDDMISDMHLTFVHEFTYFHKKCYLTCLNRNS